MVLVAQSGGKLPGVSISEQEEEREEEEVGGRAGGGGKAGRGGSMGRVIGADKFAAGDVFG